MKNYTFLFLSLFYATTYAQTPKWAIALKYDFINQYTNSLFIKVTENEKIGFVNLNLEEVIKPQYDDADDFSYHGCAHVRQGEKWGIIDTTGKIIVPIQYEEYRSMDEHKDRFSVKKDGKVGVIDAHQKVIIPFDYDNILVLDSVIVVTVGQYDINEKHGLMDVNGQPLTPVKYEKFRENIDRTITFKIREKEEVFDAKGQRFFESRMSTDEGTLPSGVTIRNGKAGLLDASGQVILPFEYDFISEFTDGFAVVYANEKVGYVNSKGVVVVKPFYELPGSIIFGGYAKVQLGTLFGFIDSTGQVVLPIKYEALGWFFSDIMPAKENGQWHYIDTKGTVLSKKYDKAEDFESKYAQVGLKNKKGVVDRSGKEIVPPIYDFVAPLKECIIAKRGEKFGLLDTLGQEKVPFIYDSFTNLGYWGGLKVCQDDKCGLIGSDGTKITPLKYQFINAFPEGVAIVHIENRYGMIDKTGIELLPVEYKKIERLRENLFVIKRDDKWGFLKLR